ncbi:MAG: sulfatase [Pirellulaceae bacterium]|nr:sulfatase [Pirellulaceae bacterium]
MISNLINRFLAIFIVLVAFAQPSFGADRAAATTEPLNVVFILVDDLGWSDLGYCGSDYYQTPHVDRLAKQSLLFRSAYAAAPVCSPTRAAIMTGKSPARLDMTIWHEGAVQGGPNDRMLLPATAVANLPREEITLAERFRQAGYITAHIGKWHLGTAAYYPETQGFDRNIGGTFWGAPSTFFFPFSGKWNEKDPEIRYVPGLPFGKPGDYLPDRLTDAAIDVIQANRDRPFFLNLWYYTVHSPIQAPKPLVDRFRAQRAGQHHRDPTYAAMVNRMDQNVGRVLAKLDELNLSERTVVVFTSDNGGVDFDQRSIVPTSNYPLRSGKGTLYEGGVRVPLLIRWPEASVGETNELCTSQDLFYTFSDMLAGDVAEVAAANDTKTTEKVKSTQDGTSLVPLLNDVTKKLPSRSLFWHFPHYYPRMTPASAVRDGDWKLIHFYEDDHRELYNLNTDPGEQEDLSAVRPGQTARLFAQLNQWRKRVDAKAPTQNPKFPAR